MHFVAVLYINKNCRPISFLNVNMVNDVHHELSEPDEIRLSKLFHSLDCNKDGRIDILDLTSAFQHLKIPHFSGHAEVLKSTLALWCGHRIASLPLPRYVVRGD